MTIKIKYTGTSDNYSELSVTGNQSVWKIGQQEERPAAEANSLLSTGLFSADYLPVTAFTNPLTGEVTRLVVGSRDVLVDLSLTN